MQKSIVKRCNINANSALTWPGGFPPVSTVRSHFHACRDSGLLATVNQLVVTAAREMEGRQAQPTAGIIDFRSVKSTGSCGICGHDSGKQIEGRKRHVFAYRGYAGDTLKDAMGGQASHRSAGGRTPFAKAV